MADKKMTLVEKVKHFVQEPVKSMEEANERRKKVLKVLFITLAVQLALGLIGMLAEPLAVIVSIVTLPCGFIVLGCLILLLVLFKLKAKFRKQQCPNCKTRITYGDNVRQTVLNKYVTRTRTNAGIIRKEYTRVQFDCRCQACGTEKIIVQDFCTGVVTVNGSSTARSEDRNLDTEIFQWWM